jgi:hypothetical protein
VSGWHFENYGLIKVGQSACHQGVPWHHRSCQRLCIPWWAWWMSKYVLQRYLDNSDLQCEGRWSSWMGRKYNYESSINVHEMRSKSLTKRLITWRLKFPNDFSLTSICWTSQGALLTTDSAGEVRGRNKKSILESRPQNQRELYRVTALVSVWVDIDGYVNACGHAPRRDSKIHFDDVCG